MSLVIGGVVWWKQNTASISSDTSNVYFTVTRGASAEKIGQSLYEKGIIRNPLAFKIYVQFFDKSGKINAGQFKLTKAMTLPQIVEALQGGPIELWVTIPEGKRREEVAGIISTALSLEGEKKDEFEEEFLNLTADKEGYLFPDTYLFPPDVTAQAVVAKFTTTFDVKFAQLNNYFSNGETKQRLTKDEVVTLASIIEREAKSHEERPTIAGILIKRLQTSGWLLQADATVQYALGNAKCQMLNATCKDWWPTILRDDLEMNSPYNSYKVKALPPTPIANPGITSLSAAANPTDSEYWFYIHEDNGQIHFATTLEEHNANIAKYLGK